MNNLQLWRKSKDEACYGWTMCQGNIYRHFRRQWSAPEKTKQWKTSWGTSKKPALLVCITKHKYNYRPGSEIVLILMLERLWFSSSIFSTLHLQLKSLKWRQKGDKDRKRENVSDSAQLNHTSLIKPLEHLHRAWIKYQALAKTWFSLQKTSYGDLLTL